MTAIAPLPRRAVDAAAVTMARAFDADPMFRWIFPDHVTRPASLRALSRVPIEYGARWGRVTSSDGVAAVSVWLPPGAGPTVPRMVRAGLLGVPFRTGLRSFAAFMKANDVMDRIHKARMPEPHWYLLLVGVDPELQGRGIGSALVKDGLAEVDGRGHPCYLETSERRNLAFYERHGFAVIEEVTLGAGGPLAWAMRREPRPTR
jgi:ribosomal protein S18 acetylase RimI-like enzyme